MSERLAVGQGEAMLGDTSISALPDVRVRPINPNFSLPVLCIRDYTRSSVSLLRSHVTFDVTRDPRPHKA